MAPGRSLTLTGATAGSPPSLGHAAHFLERLDRVPRALTDFALGLYRDEERVRWILHYAHLPEDEKRVALALDADGNGPYLVVTREGKFVTALGEGMTPKHLRILSRAQVDVFSARVEEARARRELAKDIVPGGQPPEDVMRLLKTRPWGLSREEVSAIAAWVPLLGPQFFAEAFTHVAYIDDAKRSVLALSGRTHRHDAILKPGLELMWAEMHAIGARFALSAMGDLTWADAAAATWTPNAGPTFLATGFRISSITMRGAWAAARFGRPFIPLYKRLLASSQDVVVVFDAALAMTAIGIRHARHREESRRAIQAMRTRPGPWRPAMLEALIAMSDRAFEDPEGALDEVAASGATVLVDSAACFEDASCFRFEDPARVPRELALLVAVNSVGEALHESSFFALPWVAKLASAEELYYPEELERALRTEWTSDLLMSVYERFRPNRPAPATRDAPKVGRNEACACGSAQKFKRCCGR